MSRSSPYFAKVAQLVKQDSAHLRHFLNRLEFIPTTLRIAQIGFRETQRIILELIALYDYMEIYKPVMDGFSEPSGTLAKTIGAFVSNPHTAEMFFRAGIPVWIIRPRPHLPKVRIQALAPVQGPDGLIPMNEATRPSHATIFRGHSQQKYNAIVRRHVMRYMRYPDPFGPVRAAPQAIIAPPPITPHEIRQQTHSPCKNFI